MGDVSVETVSPTGTHSMRQMDGFQDWLGRLKSEVLQISRCRPVSPDHMQHKQL